ncbi:MAG: serine/threonine-protein kinase [Byssovorax sp.]
MDAPGSISLPALASDAFPVLIDPGTVSFAPIARRGLSLRDRRVEPSWQMLAIGDRLPGTPYRVRALIGLGGMGEVVEVSEVSEVDEEGAKGPRRALKVLHPRHRGRADLAARMEREGRALARAAHRNLVRVLGQGALADGRPYLVMERLAGHDLRVELRRHGALPARRAIALAAQALDGLAAVHAAGLVHRDIKLENLFLCEDGTLKVLDLGLAKVVEGSAGEASLTAAGVCFGTPRTMAPEQHVLEPVDHRADLYAMGAVLFELCTGRGPFDELGPEPLALRYAHCRKDPPRPGAIAPRPLDPGLDAIILRALSKSPAARFQTAGEMAAALRALSARPEAPRSGSIPRASSRLARVLGPALLAGLAVMLFALGVAFGRALPAKVAPPGAVTSPQIQGISNDPGP